MDGTSVSQPLSQGSGNIAEEEAERLEEPEEAQPQVLTGINCGRGTGAANPSRGAVSS